MLVRIIQDWRRKGVEQYGDRSTEHSLSKKMHMLCSVTRWLKKMIFSRNVESELVFAFYGVVIRVRVLIGHVISSYLETLLCEALKTKKQTNKRTVTYRCDRKPKQPLSVVVGGGKRLAFLELFSQTSHFIRHLMWFTEIRVSSKSCYSHIQRIQSVLEGVLIC